MNGEFSMLDLFRAEIETQTARLSEHLLVLDAQPGDANALEALMRAAHSIKGAGRMVSVESAVRVAHVMEDVFVGAQQGRLRWAPECIDTLLAAVDMLKRIAQEADQADWEQAHAQELDTLLQALQAASSETVVTTTAASRVDCAPHRSERSIAMPLCWICSASRSTAKPVYCRMDYWILNNIRTMRHASKP